MESWVDVDSVQAIGFGLALDEPPLRTPWHAHSKHQVLYVADGLVRLSTRQGQWWLPPRKAAWLRAGTEHSISCDVPIALRTVYLSPTLNPAWDDAVRVFFVEPLAREMLLYAQRFGPTPPVDPELSRAYFDLLVQLLTIWGERAEPFRLPAPRTPEVERALGYALSNLHAEVSQRSAARAAGTSERTLQRRVAEELGMSWRRLVQTLRMLRAMELLAVPGARVTDAAYAVGMESLSAFTRAFRSFVGENPRDYMRGPRGAFHIPQSAVEGESSPLQNRPAAPRR